LRKENPLFPAQLVKNLDMKSFPSDRLAEGRANKRVEKLIDG
jgi:hypothetical protein